MPKMKTSRAAAKRFKVTGTGKLKRNKAYKRHILTKKTTKTKRNLRKATMTDETFVMAARDIYPSEALQFDKAKVLGFVTMYGTINSHTAVLEIGRAHV